MSGAGRYLAAGLLLAMSAGCADLDTRGAGGTREVTVDAEGWAPLEGTNTLSARHRALAEAQKKAVEKAVGVTLHARTRVDDAINIRQSIEANMGGTIRRYEVTSEGEDEGFFKIRIHAVVIYRAEEAPVARRAVPRLSVRIANEKAAGAVRSALASRDYELSETESGADVAVTGVVETRGLADPRLGGYYSYTAKVSLTAANARSGKVTRVEYEASAVDTEEQVACDRALENAGNESGAELAASLSEAGAPPAASGAELSELSAVADLPLP
jgi:hypothetical protein